MPSIKKDEDDYVYSPTKIPLWVWVTVIFLLLFMIMMAVYSLALKT